MPAELSALMARLAPRWTVVDEPGRAIAALEHATNGVRVEFDHVDVDADAVDDSDDDDGGRRAAARRRRRGGDGIGTTRGPCRSRCTSARWRRAAYLRPSRGGRAQIEKVSHRGRPRPTTTRRT